MAVQVFQPFEIFYDINGKPLDDGFIWVGQPNLDPETNQISIFFDEALTIPATQPIRTRNGFPANAGVQAQIFVAETTFSITIKNKNSTIIRSVAAVHSSSDLEGRLRDAVNPLNGDEIVAFKQSATGSVAKTVHGKLAERKSVLDFGAVGDFSTLNGAAFQAAINWAINNYPATLVIPEGIYLCETAWPVITRPARIYGQGAAFVQFTTAVTGQCVTVRNTGFGAEVGYLPATGDVAFTSASQIKAGPELVGFTILGNRSVSPQHGLVFEGNCDFVNVDLDIMYFNGRGVWIGKPFNNLRGNYRESPHTRLRTRCCGMTDSTASITWEITDSSSNPNEDSSNLCKNVDLESIFSYGRGVEFIDRRTTTAGPPIYGMSGKILLHGHNNPSVTQNGALLHIEGDIQLIDFDVNFAYSKADEPDLVIRPNTTTGEFPSQVRLKIMQPQSVQGAHIENGSGIHLEYISSFTKKATLTLGTGFNGSLKIDSESNGQFQATTANMTLSGTTPIAIAGWVYNSTANLSTFFPTFNTDGTGDTLRATIQGVNGVITRSGSTTLGTDTYTFTPDSASSIFIPSGSRFSKFVVSEANGVRVSGRWKYSPENRYGIASNSTFNSGRLLEMFPWKFWIEPTSTLVRYNFGDPTSATSGRPLGVWQKVFSGVTATPSVAAASLLYANYAAPTTITNMTNGVDGQHLVVIANNANTTIANNSNIKTLSGADTLLAAEVPRTFVYSADLVKWVQIV